MVSLLAKYQVNNTDIDSVMSIRNGIDIGKHTGIVTALNVAPAVMTAYLCYV